MAAGMTHIGGYRVLDTLSTSPACDVLLAANAPADGQETKVVVRVLAAAYSRHAKFADAFARGARAYALVSHTSVASLLEVLRVEERLAAVIEHVDGAPLSHVIGGVVLEDPAALRIGAEVFSALAAAHAIEGPDGAPVLHRYLSASKVLIGWDATVKVRDFALPEAAKLNAGAVGVARGAERYMAPEQVKGGEVTERADVYCAALIVWELLTRQRAFDDAKRAIDSWRAMGDPKLPPLEEVRPDIDPSIHDVVRRALAPRAEDRTVTAAEIAALLREHVKEPDGRAKLAQSMTTFRGTEPTPIAAAAEPPAPRPPPLPGGARSSTRMPVAPPRPSGRTSSARMKAAQPAAGAADVNVSERSHIAMPPPPPDPGSEPSVEAAATDALAVAATSVPPQTASTTAPPPAATTTAPPAVTVSLPIIIGAADAAAEQTTAADVAAPRRAPAIQPTPAQARSATRRGPAYVPPEDVAAKDVANDVAASPGPSVETIAKPSRARPALIFGGLVCATALVAYGAGIGRSPNGVAPKGETTATSSTGAAASSNPLAPTTAAATSAHAKAEPPPGSTASMGKTAAVASAPASGGATAIPADMGLLKTPAHPPGRRIFVDDRVVGETPTGVLVKCGAHTVMIGSAGRRQPVDIPCGGEVNVER